MSNAYNLRLVGYTIAQLQREGYTESQILGAGYNANELRLASYNALQLKNAGYTSRSIVEGGYNDKELKKAGIKTAYELRKMGYSAFQIANEGYSGKIFKELKFTPTELLDPEVSPTQMRSLGYCIADMKTAGFNPHELISTGFELRRIVTAGYGLDELFIATVTVDDIKNKKIPAIKTLYTPTELVSVGLSVSYLRGVGFTADELKASGFNATDLRTGGYDPIQIYNAGYSLSEMKEGGLLSYEVSQFGFTFNDLVSVGYAGEELNTAGYQEFANIVVLGYTSISGFVNFMTTNNATLYNNGGIIIAGGIGIAKDLYLNELHTKLQMNVDVSGQIVHDGTNLSLIQLIENGVIRFTVNENRIISLILTNNGYIDFQFPNKTIEVKYNNVNIPSTTLATSTTTGALTCVGGISTQNNVYSQTFVSCDASDNEAIRIDPSSGVICNSNSGIVNVSNQSINIGKNNALFGTRLMSEPSAVLQINGATGVAFSFSKQEANSQTATNDLTIASNGIVNISNTTQSVDTNSGSLQTNGAIGVDKNVNVEGTIQMWDILNSGSVTQSSTSLQFLSGNSSTPTPTSTKELFGIRTAPPTSFSNADLQTHIYNNANPSTPKNILTQTFSITSSFGLVDNISITPGYPLFSAIYLKKDQVIKGVVHICSSIGGVSNYYAGIYGKGSQPMRLAHTGSTARSLNQGFNYIDFETVWTVPTSDVYYIGHLTVGSNPTTLCVNANSNLSYSMPGPESGTLRKATQWYGSGNTTSLPTQVPNVGMNESPYLVYVAVY